MSENTNVLSRIIFNCQHDIRHPPFNDMDPLLHIGVSIDTNIKVTEIILWRINRVFYGEFVERIHDFGKMYHTTFEFTSKQLEDAYRTLSNPKTP